MIQTEIARPHLGAHKFGFNEPFQRNCICSASSSCFHWQLRPQLQFEFKHKLKWLLCCLKNVCKRLVDQPFILHLFQTEVAWELLQAVSARADGFTFDKDVLCTPRPIAVVCHHHVNLLPDNTNAVKSQQKLDISARIYFSMHMLTIHVIGSAA